MSGMAQARGRTPAQLGPSPEAGASYIRGGGGAAVDPRRLLRVIGGLAAVAVAALAIVLTVQAASQSSQMRRLQQHGVAVEATVSGCLGLASGTGVTQAGFSCRAAFVLDGRRYDEPVRGTLARYPAGTVLQGIAVPGDPALLATAQAVRHASSPWHAYLTPAILFAAEAVAGLWVGWRRWRPGRAAG